MEGRLARAQLPLVRGGNVVGRIRFANAQHHRVVGCVGALQRPAKFGIDWFGARVARHGVGVSRRAHG